MYKIKKDLQSKLQTVDKVRGESLGFFLFQD